VLSIGERAAAVEQSYDSRIQMSVDALDEAEKRKLEAFEQETLREYENLAQEYVEADAERRRLKLDENTYAIYTVLKLVHKGEAPTIANTVNALFEKYAEYQWDNKQEMQLRAEIYNAVRPTVGRWKDDRSNKHAPTIEEIMMSEQRARPPAPPNTWPSADDLKAAAYAWAERINITLLQVSVRKMRRKWASISTVGRLTLSTDLLQIPEELWEFVIVHELVHLLVPNHGKVFKSFMLAYLPDWEEKERLLQQYR
jgi:hypothetical protein